MGKSKKRILARNTEMSGINLKRNEIIKQVLSDIRTNKITDDTKKFILLFGVTTEELSEAGAEFEDLEAFKHLII